MTQKSWLFLVYPGIFNQVSEGALTDREPGHGQAKKTAPRRAPLLYPSGIQARPVDQTALAACMAAICSLV